MNVDLSREEAHYNLPNYPTNQLFPFIFDFKTQNCLVALWAIDWIDKINL